ncbi:penicillin-binding protein 1B [Marinicella litoralis]|uniref:Penicillin-binding protein 1B n=1 Tax=Marinicella litoralis TaxID=644220 RepID=A0A4R6Y0V5_9GAMM|nr:penicillin-binding protein 1B [Marinicella litoralis]
MLGLVVPWYFYINHVTNSIVNERWDVPSVVYARPLELYKNKKISPQALMFELDSLGYIQVSNTPKLGQYQRFQSSFDIYTKGFDFAEGGSVPRRLKLKLANGVVESISPDLYRLEPKVIGHFFSAGLENRQPIKVEEIPDTMVTGLQAVEDRSFSEHHGVSWFGILRAAIKNILAGEVVQGGSTITQQLVKNKLQYNHNSLLRKLHEALAATLLETKLDKKAIIEMYFNEIYWGQDGKVSIHGVVEAAEYYFAKPVTRLSVAEQALLVGIIKGPSWYNPFKQAQRATARRNLVLNTWYETGVIGKNQWQSATQQPLGLSQHRRLKTDFEDYMDVVKRQLRSQFSPSDLKQKGLKIFTYLDPYIQYKTTQTAKNTNQWLSTDVESAIVVSGAQNAELLAITGSKNAKSHYNRALLAKRQIGSLIKPLVYLAGLELLPGFDLQQPLNDSELTVTTTDGKLWQPKNWDQQSWGEISAERALIYSRNQATVDLGLKVGLDNFIAYLTQLGLNINRSDHPSLFLGAIDLTPFEVQHLFGLFASRGKNQQIYAVNYITQSNGKLLSQSQQVRQKQPKTAHIDAINRALHAITTEGTANKVTQKFNLPQPMFGKTGTTNKGRDSWFSGFNQELLVTVWVGRDDNKPTPYSGSNGALILWSHLFMNL